MKSKIYQHVMKKVIINFFFETLLSKIIDIEGIGGGHALRSKLN